MSEAAKSLGINDVVIYDTDIQQESFIRWFLPLQRHCRC
ncbi:MAG: hypothetical protein ACI4AE_05815 [Candidatus Cryptobacteroides sp.]